MVFGLRASDPGLRGSFSSRGNHEEMAMRRCALSLIVLAFLGIDPSVIAAQGEDMLIRAAVRRVLGPRVFTIEYQAGEDGELVVLAPEAEATPVPGTTVLAGGVLRQVDHPRLKDTPGWNEIDDPTRQRLAGGAILVATSVRTAAGRQLTARASASQAPAPLLRQPSPDLPRPPIQARLHPAALAELIDELGGGAVTLPRARVLVVLNPRAFLIESASPLPALVGNLDRLLVLVDAGALRADPARLVGSNVTVIGTARTLLGLQLTGEVPLPDVLTPEILKRFEIKAAVLATSVQSADGVELTNKAAQGQ